MLADKKSLRPIIHTIHKNLDSSELEIFQNECLRPIIKLQHQLIMSYFECFLTKYESTYSKVDVQMKKEFVFEPLEII